MKRVCIAAVLLGIGVIFWGLRLQPEEEQQVTNNSQLVSVQQDKTNSPIQQKETSTQDFTRIVKGAVFTYEANSDQALDLLLNGNMTTEEKKEKYDAIKADVVDARNTVINMQLSDEHSKELAQKSADMLFSLYHAINESKSLIDLNYYYTRTEDKQPFEEAINAKNKIVVEHKTTAAKIYNELKNSSLFK
ncbi:hypothetical protein B5G50_15545 [Brevibacillus brevis]|uniref:hypothetical protein n=1 Tax=Brevibacillus brevis TaxID=1393 RepID=UPI000B36E3A4|nr:hypothetical protein [Brevibacillus brevis]OUQ87425.1 hypothetical protein B5G50_15545 [Brevibacillus brevis]